MKAARQRQKETISAVSAIHGGSLENLKPGTVGMLETLERKCKECDVLEGVKKSKLIKEKVFPKIYKENVKLFEQSNSNMLRSISVYYSKGVMGKEKYKAVYKSSSYMRVPGKKGAVRIKVANCPAPRLVPYHRLMAYIKSLDIGKLYDVGERFCAGLEDSENVRGCYRDIEDLLVKLADFYLNYSQFQVKLNESNIFYVALGGDGAPFGKDDTACSWLVSFLNIGQGILSSNENFLLFGANCSENCLPVRRFLNQLMLDINKIQTTSYSIACKGEAIDVRFVFAELPNDMKMLSFLAGELSNSATFFSTFADVDHRSIAAKGTATFGRTASDTWKPWKYSQRVKVAKAVEKFKQTVNRKNVSEKTKRSNITSFIAKQSSRQEFIPLVGEMIDRAHVEPLHLKNNACALAHRYLLKLAVSTSNLNSISSFKQVPQSTPFFKYVETLRGKCKLTRLAKRIVRWYDDCASCGKDFEYRFTGKDSRMFLHNFMFLIDLLEKNASEKSEILHIHAYLCLCLRNAVSLFSRVNITDQQVQELEKYCREYYRGYWLFLSVNPTVWTLGQVVPEHTKEMRGSYGMGLGINSMEGREAKHIAIAKYATNTMHSCRWEQVFHHEYISLVWLRSHGYTTNINNSLSNTPLSYIPERVFNKDPHFCNCGLDKVTSDQFCRFCGHGMREKIKDCIVKCKKLI